MYLDLKALRDSGVLDKLVGSAVNEEPEYKLFVQQTGFDYKTDLDTVVATSLKDTHYFILRGHFDWKNVISYVTSQGGACLNGFCRITDPKGNRNVSLYAVNKQTMALSTGSNEWGASEIRIHNEGIPFEVPKQPVWLSLPAATLQTANKLPPGTRQFAKVVEGAERLLFTMGARENGFEIVADVTCKTAEQAAVLKTQLEDLTKVLQSLIAREKQTPNLNDLSGVLTSGNFQRVDRHVLGRWPVQRAFIDSLGGG